jgi:hypothetical protein
MANVDNGLESVEIIVEDRKVMIPTWNMRTQINNTSFVMPLVSEPMINAMAVADEDSESLYVAAVIKGVTSALAQSDLNTVIPKLLDGVVYYNENGVPKMASLEALEKEGFKYHHILKICVEVIRHNVGPLLQGGLQDLMILQ